MIGNPQRREADSKKRGFKESDESGGSLGDDEVVGKGDRNIAKNEAKKDTVGGVGEDPKVLGANEFINARFLKFGKIQKSKLQVF